MLVPGCYPFPPPYVAARQTDRAARQITRAAGRCRPRRRPYRPRRRLLPPSPPALPPLPPLRAAAGLAALADLPPSRAAAWLAALADLPPLRSAAGHAAPPPVPLAHAHRVLNLAVAHLAVEHLNSSNAVGPQPVREHDNTEWPRADKCRSAQDTVVTSRRVRTPPSVTRTRVPAFALSPG